MFLVGISLGGVIFPWASAGAITPIVVGALLLVCLGLWEAFVKLEAPIFPRAVFANIRGFTVIAMGIFLLGMLYYSTAVLWPQQVAVLYTQKPSDIGWYSSTVGMAGSIVGPIAGWVFIRVGHARWVLTTTVFLLSVVSGAQAIVTPTSNIASTILTALIGGLVAAATVITTTMIQLGVPHEFIGVATGLAITMRSVGGSVATTIYSTVLSSRFKSYLVTDAAGPLAAAGVNPESVGPIIAALLSGSAHDPVLAGLSPEVLGLAAQGIKEAFAHSLRIVYLVSIAFGVIGTICVSFSKNVDHLMTKKIEVRLRK